MGLYCSGTIYVGVVASWHLPEALFSKRISSEGVANVAIVPESWKWKQARPYYFTIVSIQKKISICLESQTKLQMSTLSRYTPRMVNLFWTDENRKLQSSFSLEWQTIPLSPLGEKKPPQHCRPKKGVLSKTWWFKVEFLFGRTSLGCLFSGTFCLPQREAA